MRRSTRAFLPVTLFLGSVAAMENPMSDPGFSPLEKKTIDAAIAALTEPEEMRRAMQGSSTRKVANYLCRPLAAHLLASQMAGADELVLGTDDPHSLRLVNHRRLDGSGSVHVHGGTVSFHFSCTLNPQTGHASDFVVTYRP
jgi:hypothetical protein